MRSIIRRTALAALPLSVSAFPAFNQEAAIALARTAATLPQSKEKRDVMFDPVAQLVDVTGEHAFTPPDFGAGDQRGPCPGLNALANHNYLPHNGIADWEDIVTQTVGVFGLGKDIASFLSIYGAIFDGNIVSLSPGYSIGGPSSLNQNIIGGAGILGTPQGLSGSHNKYESDASAARGDLYTSGNDYKLDINRFKALYVLQSSATSPSYDLPIWYQHRANMFLKSKHENPQFFYAPFAGVIASTGGFTFPPRMMSNKSAEHPDNGILDKENLKTFFSITGDDDNLTYTYGYERIPENFYKRAIGNEYTVPKFFDDLFALAAVFPETFSTGGNTGTVDSYAALDISNFTGGVYNGATLLEGNNLVCFVFESMLAAAPDVLKGGYADPSGPMRTLTDNVNAIIGDYECPQIDKLNEEQFAMYPGAQPKSASGGILSTLL